MLTRVATMPTTQSSWGSLCLHPGHLPPQPHSACHRVDAVLRCQPLQSHVPRAGHRVPHGGDWAAGRQRTTSQQSPAQLPEPLRTHPHAGRDGQATAGSERSTTGETPSGTPAAAASRARPEPRLRCPRQRPACTELRLQNLAPRNAKYPNPHSFIQVQLPFFLNRFTLMT